MTPAQEVDSLKRMLKSPGLSADAQRQLKDKLKKAEAAAGSAKRVGKKVKASKPSKAAAKPSKPAAKASKPATKTAKASKPATKTAKAVKPSVAKAPKAKSSPKAKSKPKAAKPMKGVMPAGLAAYRAKKAAEAAAAAKPSSSPSSTSKAAQAEKKSKPMAAAKKKSTKKSAKKKSPKETEVKVQAAAPAAKPAAKKKRKPAKKAKAKKVAKATAPKKATTPKKAKAKKAKRSKAKAKAPMAAAAPKTKAKRSKSKKAGKKTVGKSRSKAKRSKAKGKTKSRTIVSRGVKGVNKAAKKARKGMKLVRSTKNYKRGNKSLTVRQVTRSLNPIGGDMKTTGIVIGTAIVGFAVTDVVDRLVATRGGDAPYAWHSVDAANRIMLRPDAMRLGAQALIAAIGFGTGALLNKRAPNTSSAFTGFGLGALIKLGSAILNGYLMPVVFSVSKGDERNLGNRLFPLEQSGIQEPALARIEEQNKNPKAAPSQGGTETNLPPTFLFASSTPPATPATPAGTAGVFVNPQVRRVQRVNAPMARPGIPASVGEPAARAAMRTAPLAGCADCGTKNDDPAPGMAPALNIAMAPRLTPPPEVSLRAQQAVGTAALTSIPQRANGRPRGNGPMPGATTGLAGVPGKSPKPKSRLSHIGR